MAGIMPRVSKLPPRASRPVAAATAALDGALKVSGVQNFLGMIECFGPPAEQPARRRWACRALNV